MKSPSGGRMMNHPTVHDGIGFILLRLWIHCISQQSIFGLYFFIGTFFFKPDSRKNTISQFPATLHNSGANRPVHLLLHYMYLTVLVTS